MDGLITLYIDVIRKISLKRRYKVFSIAVFFIVISGGFVCTFFKLNILIELYPYTVLSATKYLFAPIAVLMLATDIAQPRIGKELFLTSWVIVSFLFKIFLGVLIASSILSVTLGGIDSISLAVVMRAYIINFVPVAALTVVAVFIVALIKSIGNNQ